jgi:teichuronic acid biosynthesis glycosyltransferase TuaC
MVALHTSPVEVEPSADRPQRILVVSAAFPSVAQPGYGIFVKERVRALADLPGYEVRVIAPVPYFPPIRRFAKWYIWSQFPKQEIVNGLTVMRPRYVLPPKVGHYFQAYLMYRAIRRAAARMRQEFDFDVVDGHFAYPSGVAAAWTGHTFGKPVVITGRGEDMHRFVKQPIVGPQVRKALRQAAYCIGVSQEIAQTMQAHGASPERLAVISNGVNCETFRPQPQDQARHTLGLPLDAKIVLSVGDRFENKGFHLLLEALPAIRRQHPNTLLVIVGGPPRFGTDYTPEIEQRIQALGLADCVRLPGSRPHSELVSWYNAADIFALLSAREGSPNVLMEALACGTPTVATPVGGVPQVLEDESLGILLPERSVAAAADGLVSALSRDWDRPAIRRILERRSWRHTALQIHHIFQSIAPPDPAPLVDCRA